MTDDPILKKAAEALAMVNDLLAQTKAMKNNLPPDRPQRLIWDHRSGTLKVTVTDGTSYTIRPAPDIEEVEAWFTENGRFVPRPTKSPKGMTTTLRVWMGRNDELRFKLRFA